MAENKGGRPTKLTDEIVRKLEEAFAIDATVTEACYYADISTDTYYRWIKENPELSDKFDRLRERPIFMARQKVIDEIKKDTRNAQWYLERKKKDEFAPKEIRELEGKISVEEIIKQFDEPE